MSDVPMKSLDGQVPSRTAAADTSPSVRDPGLSAPQGLYDPRTRRMPAASASSPT